MRITSNNFILVTKDAEGINERLVRAISVLKHRLKINLWPIYENTRGRKQFAVNSRIAFYIGGTAAEKGTIVATAIVSSLREPEGYENVDERILEEPPSLLLSFKNVKWLNSPIVFRDRVEKLSFCPKNMSKWGVVLMGGCRTVSDEDWDKIFF